MPMAIRTFDELKGIKEEIQTLNARKKIRKFFDEMELPEDKKEKRTDLALRFYHEMSAFLITMSTFLAQRAVTNIEGIIVSYDIDEADISAYISELVGKFNETLEDMDIPQDVITGLQNHIYDSSDSIVRTTFDKPNDYNLSSDRAELIAETETNVEGNYEDFLEAIANGYTTKTWVTMRDKKVRKTHKDADGQTVGIFDTFKVGDTEMRFPLDWEYGTPEEIISCRCVLEYS